MRIYELGLASVKMRFRLQVWGGKTYGGCNSGPLHLVQDATDLFEICNVSARWVECALAVDGALWKGVNEEFHRAARVDLEVQVARQGVLPDLVCL